MSGTQAVRLPDLGEGLTGAEVVTWLVAVADTVAKDQPLVEVATDKAIFSIPSPIAGSVTKLCVEEGDWAATSDVLVEIAAAPDGGEPPTRAMPAVRVLAARLGVDLDGLRPGQVVTEADVRAAAHAREAPPRKRGHARGEPLSGVRREIAEHMTEAAAVPTVTLVEECDFSAIPEDGTPYARAAAIVAATARALAEHPELNATLVDGVLHQLEQIDVGYAVQGPHGLVVPVVRGAGERSEEDLAVEIERLVRGARAGRLRLADLRGGTFTITDARRLGGLFATPLLNTPQVAILGIHRIAPRPVVRDGEVVVRPVGMLSVGFDHRALDGAAASAFLLDLIDRIERRQEGST